jgi:hypothetical protein
VPVLRPCSAVDRWELAAPSPSDRREDHQHRLGRVVGLHQSNGVGDRVRLPLVRLVFTWVSVVRKRCIGSLL